MRYYPIYLDLKDRAVLVAGGGLIAEGKALQLLEAGAKLRLVSPDLTQRLAELAERGEIEYRQRKFETEDLLGVTLVISATNDQAANSEIAELIGDEYGELLEVAAEMRAEAKRLIPDFDERRKVLHAFAESEAIELLRAGRREEARQLAFALLEQEVGNKQKEGKP